MGEFSPEATVVIGVEVGEKVVRHAFYGGLEVVDYVRRRKNSFVWW